MLFLPTEKEWEYLNMPSTSSKAFPEKADPPPTLRNSRTKPSRDVSINLMKSSFEGLMRSYVYHYEVEWRPLKTVALGAHSGSKLHAVLNYSSWNLKNVISS